MKKTSSLLCTILLLSAALSASFVFAAEVAPEQAELAAKNWVRRNPATLTAAFASAEPVRVQSARNGSNRALYHVVELDGAGYVVLSGDTELPPVVAFSGSGTLDLSDPGNPLVALLENDLPGRIASLDSTPAPAKKSAVKKGTAHPYAAEWAELLSEPPPAKKGGATKKSGRTSLSDVRVAPLVKSKWGQGKWNGQDTFNYYTPNHYLCGCVATATAQIMRYWKRPAKSVSAGTYRCWVDGARVKATLFGGTYSWSDMPLTEASCTTLEQRQAIGKLLFDVGVASQMEWADSGSGTVGGHEAQALRGRFGYASAQAYYVPSGGLHSDMTGSTSYRNAILASLDARMPVSLGICSSDAGGHQVVVDGYGFQNGRVYCHLNCGWSGSEDIWYNLMGESVTTDGYQAINSIVYNIHPTRRGDVVSGRVLDPSGKPARGATVKLAAPSGGTKTAKTDAKGIYSFRVGKSGKYTLSAACGASKSAKRTVSVRMSQSASMTLDGRGCVSSSSRGRLGNSWGNTLKLVPNKNLTAAFNAHGGSCSFKRRTVKIGARIGKLPAAKRSGWKFLGWYTKKSGGKKISANTKLNASRTFHAHWAKNWCRTTFKANGGKGKMGVQNLPYLKVVRLNKNKFTRKGYRFAGWALSPNGKVEFKNEEKVRNERASGTPLTLYAKWVRVGKIAFNANGGRGKMRPQKVVYGKRVKLRKNTFTRKGCRFAGWATSPNGPVKVGNGAVIRYRETNGRTVTLYAKWKRVAKSAAAAKDGASGPAGATSSARVVAGKNAPVAVTASGGGDASAVVDGNEATSWSPGTAEGSWVVLTLAAPCMVEDVEVFGDNLPGGTRFLVSEDADEWSNCLPAKALYVWVVFPAGDAAPVVKEIRVRGE
jgi:uncharacterized repeat protein (TIGR02543 family)